MTGVNVTQPGVSGGGAPASDLVEANSLSSGQETVPRMMAASTAAVGLNSQALRLAYFTSRRAFTTSQVRVISGSTAAAATPTLVRLGLYLIDGSDGGTLVASTVNDTALFAATFTAYTRSWSAPYAMVQGQRYALGALVVSGVAVPNLMGMNFGAGINSEMNLAPRLTAQIVGQADLPASFLAASISASVVSGMAYGVILP